MDIQTQFPVGCKVVFTKGEDKGCVAEVTGHREPEDFLVQNVTESVLKLRYTDKQGVGVTGWNYADYVRRI